MVDYGSFCNNFNSPQIFTFLSGMKRIYYQRVKFISFELLDTTFLAYWGQAAGDFFSYDTKGKKEPKEIASCPIPHLVIAYAQQE